MRPGATEVLNGVKGILFTMLFPELQTDQARQQAMYATVLIDHVIARWHLEIPLLTEERAELRALLAQALAVIDDPRVRDALAASTEAPAGPDALSADTDRLRRLVPLIAEQLPQSGDAHATALGAAVCAYVRNQHRRDQRIVQVGALAW